MWFSLVSPSGIHRPSIRPSHQSFNKSRDCFSRCWMISDKPRKFGNWDRVGDRGAIKVRIWDDKNKCRNKENGSEAVPPPGLCLSDELEWTKWSMGKGGQQRERLVQSTGVGCIWPYLYMSLESHGESATFHSSALNRNALSSQPHRIDAQMRWSDWLECPPVPICCKGLPVGPSTTSLWSVPVQRLDLKPQGPAWKWGSDRQLSLSHQWESETVPNRAL